MAKYAPVKRVQLIREGRIENARIKGSHAAIELAKNYFRYVGQDDQEHFAIAVLDTKNNVEAVIPITTGTLDASLVHPREVFRPAVALSASAILLLHNHPSGDPTPSREDLAVTKRLSEAGRLLGIDVIDHIVHGDFTTNCVSIREFGWVS